jgi:Protein kinase domain/Putative DNA-binding domain
VFSNNNSILPNGLTVSAWEACVLGQLGNHPNIATAHDYWEEGKTAVMATRYLSGGTLQDLIARSQETGERFPAERILELSLEIARGLAHIHGRRILYRDLQPRNVLLDEWGVVHLVDFDTAVSFDERDISDLPQRPVIEYMAPELVGRGGADERADLYSLGATIYAMAAGHPPFAGTREEILAARSAGPPAPLDRNDLPAALHELVFNLLAFEPEQRPASATYVVEQFDDLCVARAELERLLTSEETARLEFKASLRAEHGVIKTIAAFLNTDGGTLAIGVGDDRQIVGIEVDFTRTKGARDGWRCAFDDLVSKHLDTGVMSFIDLRLEPWQGRTIAIVKCGKRDEPTLVDDDGFYVRRTASTVKLSTREALAWCHQGRG